MNPPNLQHRPEIDGLRALAIVLVVAYHSGVPGIIGGFVGVDFFFVLSGFLITRVLWHGLQSSRTIDFSAFYARRVLRLLPAFLLVGLCCLLLAPYFVPPFGEVQRLAKSGVSAAAFTANIHFWAGSNDYFNPDSANQAFLHLWSLAVEEQFYLLWPLALLLSWRAGADRNDTQNPARTDRNDVQDQARTRRVNLSLLLVAGASLLACLWLTQSFNKFAFFMMPTRAWQFAAGALLAVNETRLRDWLGVQTGGVLAWIGALLLMLAAVLLRESDQYPGHQALLPTAGAVLLLAGAASPGILQRLLQSAPMTWIGERSYEIYLWHWPVLVFAREAWLQDVPALASMCLMAGVVLLADLTRRLEQALRRWISLHRPTTRQIVAAGMLGSLVFALAALSLGAWAKYGWKSPLQRQVTQIASDSPSAAVGACGTAMETADADPAELIKSVCRFGPVNPRTPTYVLWGDSHARMLSEAFLGAAADPQLLLVSRSACPGLSGY